MEKRKKETQVKTDLVLIAPYCPEAGTTARLKAILKYSLEGYTWEEITTVSELECADLKGRRILFAISLGKSGINLTWYTMMKYFRLHQDSLDGVVGGVILDGNCEFYTKSVGRNMVFTTNRAGCTFPGRPLVEGTRTLHNYDIQAKNLHTDNLQAYMEAGRQLVENIVQYRRPRLEHPKLLVLHAGNRKISNSLQLWELMEQHLSEFEIQKISLRNGFVHDCRGCSYDVCRHFGEEGSCFYGGPIAEEVYPAILGCDGLVMVCPNYNDALSANLTAFINRMTALFTTHRFYDKALFGVIVSGYSGSDIVAEQLISGLNMNKTFALPGKFAILETANRPGEILQVSGIEEKAAAFADHIREHLTGRKSHD